MPLRPKKQLPKIIDNLENFSEMLVQIIADESVEGSKKLLASIENAKTSYKQPIDSWITGWLYKYTRVRSKEIESAIKEMKAFPDSVSRSQEFMLLVSKGGWEYSSFNHYLFEELIKIVPGFEPLEPEVVHLVVMRLKELLNDKINLFMRDYQINQKLIAAREQERARVKTQEKDVSRVHVVSDLKEAQELNKAKARDQVFYLEKKEKFWKVTWFNLEGKTFNFELTEELVKILSQNKITDLNKVNTSVLQKIKIECAKMQEDFINRSFKLQINPNDPNETLAEKGATSTFVLRGKPNSYNLTWINTLGASRDIDLSLYSDFQFWLNNNADLTKEEDKFQLKLYLLRVNTKNALGRDEFKNKLSSCLHGGGQKPKLVEISVNKLGMSLFRIELEKLLGEKLQKGPQLKGDNEAQKTQTDAAQTPEVQSIQTKQVTPRVKLNPELVKNVELLLKKGTDAEEPVSDENLSEEPKVKVFVAELKPTIEAIPEQPKRAKINPENYAQLTQFFGSRAKFNDEAPTTQVLSNPAL